MGPLSACLLQYLREIRNLNSRFVRFNCVTPSSTIMGTRSLKHSHKCNENPFDTGSLLCISHILSNPPSTKQNIRRPSSHSDIDKTLLENTVVLSASVGNVKEIISNTKFNHTFSRSKRESLFISAEQSPHISGTAGFQGVYEETTLLIAKSRSQSALRNYELACRKWSGWCDSWKVDSFWCPVIFDLEYLSSLFYNEKLLTEQLVLFLSCLCWWQGHWPKPFSVFSTSSRASGIHHLDVRFMVNTGDTVTFHFHNLHNSRERKTSTFFSSVCIFIWQTIVCGQNTK